MRFFREKKLKDKTLFTIKSRKGKNFNISFADATTSLLATGATGSGKTASIMYPILDSLVRNACPGIVLDVKGDYLHFMEEVAATTPVVFVGGSTRCSQFNILAGMTRASFSTFAETLAASDKPDGWGKQAVASCLLIFDLINAKESRNPTLAELVDYLKSPLTLVDDLMTYLNGAKVVSDYLLNAISVCVSSAFSILNYGIQLSPHPSLYGDFFGTQPSGYKISEQYTWHHDDLIKSLSEFTENPLLRKNLSSPESSHLDMAELIYEKNSVIVVDMPIAIYSAAGYTLCKLIRNQFYSAVFTYDTEKRKAKGYGDDKFSFMLVDEYQAYANFESQSGVYNDNTFVDKSRSFGQINVFATQGLSSLLSVARNSLAVDSFIQNIRNKIFLSTDDEPTISKIRTFCGWKEVDRLINPDRMGTCYVYLGKNEQNNNGAASGIGYTGIFFDHFIDAKFNNIRAGNYQIVENSSRNPFIDGCVASKGAIYVVTHRTGKVRDDFISGIQDCAKLHNVDAKTLLERVKFIYFPKNPTDNQMYATLKRAIKRSTPSDTLCLIRGGGQAADFRFYNHAKVYELVRKSLDEGMIADFIASVGHHTDRTRIDKLSAINASTPTQLGYKLVTNYASPLADALAETRHAETPPTADAGDGENEEDSHSTQQSEKKMLNTLNQDERALNDALTKLETAWTRIEEKIATNAEKGGTLEQAQRYAEIFVKHFQQMEDDLASLDGMTQDAGAATHTQIPHETSSQDNRGNDLEDDEDLDKLLEGLLSELVGEKERQGEYPQSSLDSTSTIIQLNEKREEKKSTKDDILKEVDEG